MREFEYIIAKEHKEDRLDHFLASIKEIGLTRSQIHRLIDDGYIEVNKEIPKASYKIKTDDRILVKIPAPKKLQILPENILLDIVYEDNDLVVINKPRGMVVHPGAGRDSGTLVNALLYHCENLSGIGGVLRPGIVHRLDKDTSGLMVVAKNDFSHNALSRQFKSRKVLKQYLALVHGVVHDDEGKVEGKIGRHPMHRKKMAIINTYESRGKGREAITFYKVLERFKNYSLVEVTLKTGRMHQIRVHLTSIGHSIVGDPTYGHRREEYKVKGQLLHAAKIGFIHPRSGKYLEFFRDMPEDMGAIVNELRAR